MLTVVLVAALMAAHPAAGAPSFIEGIVTDPTGAAIAHAQVTIQQTRLTAITDRAGRFVLQGFSTRPIVLVVEARGFAAVEHAVKDPGVPQTIVLGTPRLVEEMTVTATRTPTRLRETAASIVVVTREELRSTASPALDDALRQVPGFTLFRRSGSRTANPTSQGASLRGIGASGASRAVVLDDGVPLNDPFGGWVSWGRVPRLSISRIEVLRGGASELYGSGALSGVIQLIRDHDGSGCQVEASYGSEETAEASVHASIPFGKWGLAISSELFRTDGYLAVSPQERGPVDRAVNSRRAAADATLQRSGNGGRMFVRGSFFEETRANGTPLQTNDTGTSQLTFGGDWARSDTSLAFRGFLFDQLYNQTFSAISADRRSERLTRLQQLPVDAAGLSGQFAKSFRTHSLIGGFEARQVEGWSDERILGASMTQIRAGGKQQMAGLYLQDLFHVNSRLSVTAAARFDSWHNTDARRASGEKTVELQDRRDSSVSPRLSALYRVGEHLSLTASVYRSFRAPTLNELYRSFRVGNVVTLANENLHAERLKGAEIGAILSRPRLVSRLAVYRMQVDGNIANVTLEVEPDLITRLRQNLGETRSRGIEIDVQSQVRPRLRLAGGYLFVDAEVRSFPANSALEGSTVAQVPRHQASAQVLLLQSPLDVALQVRWTDNQFEDDQNQFRLDSYTIADAFVSGHLTSRLQAFAAFENLLDQQYEIGKTPVTTIGPSRSIRVGIRLIASPRHAR